MRTRELPTVERLNLIQAEWMKLDPGAPELEKKRVFKLMEEYPATYVSGHDGKGVCQHHGMPCSVTVTFGQALETCKALGGRCDVAWNGKLGVWYSIV
jgi:hypothetical protein